MSLLALPAEIRTQIHYLVCVAPNADSSVYIDSRILHPFAKCTLAVQPALSYTNRRIRDEVLGVFYSQNDFVLALLNENSIRIAQRWIECTKTQFWRLRDVVIKVYPSFDGRPLEYEEFRWHAHGPYWLRLRFRHRDGKGSLALGEVVYVPGVTLLSGIVARLWSTKTDGWLVTAVEMVVETIAKHLEAIGREICFVAEREP